MRILIVEGDPKLAASLYEQVDAAGYSPHLVPSPEEAFYLLQTQSFHLFILDLDPSGRDSLDILRALRKGGVNTLTLLLGSSASVEERVLGLDAGGDDYLLKPFVYIELMARVRALLRRATPNESQFTLADLTLDASQRVVTRGGQSIGLTLREFEILHYLFMHSPRVVSREMLARDVWKATNTPEAMDNTIDAHIARLRGKVDGRFGSKLVRTVRGVGFALRAEHAH